MFIDNTKWKAVHSYATASIVGTWPKESQTNKISDDQNDAEMILGNCSVELDADLTKNLQHSSYILLPAADPIS